MQEQGRSNLTKQNLLKLKWNEEQARQETNRRQSKSSQKTKQDKHNKQTETWDKAEDWTRLNWGGDLNTNWTNDKLATGGTDQTWRETHEEDQNYKIKQETPK